MRRRIAITITGLVQGVFFRDGARSMAEEMGIVGFIRNEPDGSVYAEAEGESGDTDRFVQWCRRGPVAARVEGVEVTEKPLQGGKGFVVSRAP